MAQDRKDFFEFIFELVSTRCSNLTSLFLNHH